MKRFRVIPAYWDGRQVLLDSFVKTPPTEGSANYAAFVKMLSEFKAEFGEDGLEFKIHRYLEMEKAPVSILSDHNQMLSAARKAYISGYFYPSLVSCCALGERILNSILLSIRSYYTSTRQFKRVYKKKSFDDWKLPIEVLSAWGVLDIETQQLFDELRELRNFSIHYNADLEQNINVRALEAIRLISRIIGVLFSAMEPNQFFIPESSGATFIRKSQEDHPLVKEFYLPHCIYVGPEHNITNLLTFPWQHSDRSEYPDLEITDQEFARLYKAAHP